MDGKVLDRKDSYSREDILRCGHGELFGPGNARLPLPPMLMIDRIARITEDGGEYGKEKSWPSWTSGRTFGSSPATSSRTR